MLNQHIIKTFLWGLNKSSEPFRRLFLGLKVPDKMRVRNKDNRVLW